MPPRPGGNASKAEQARRLEIIAVLWRSGYTLETIGQRVGLSPSRVTQMARRAGLPERYRARPTSLGSYPRKLAVDFSHSADSVTH